MPEILYDEWGIRFKHPKHRRCRQSGKRTFGPFPRPSDCVSIHCASQEDIVTSLKTISLLSFLILAQARTTIKDFTDEDFRRSLAQHDRVLFYSFSPRMALSVEGLKEIQQAASDLRAEP